VEGELRRRRRVHADDLTLGVEERAARVARLNPGVRLDQPSEVLGGTRRVRRRDRLVEGCHRAGRQGDLSIAARVAAGRHLRADGNGCRPDRNGLQARSTLKLEESNVGGAVIADDPRLVAVAGIRDDDVDLGSRR